MEVKRQLNEVETNYSITDLSDQITTVNAPKEKKIRKTSATPKKYRKSSFEDKLESNALDGSDTSSLTTNVQCPKEIESKESLLKTNKVTEKTSGNIERKASSVSNISKLPDSNDSNIPPLYEEAVLNVPMSDIPNTVENELSIVMDVIVANDSDILTRFSLDSINVKVSDTLANTPKSTLMESGSVELNGNQISSIPIGSHHSNPAITNPILPEFLLATPTISKESASQQVKRTSSATSNSKNHGSVSSVVSETGRKLSQSAHTPTENSKSPPNASVNSPKFRKINSIASNLTNIKSKLSGTIANSISTSKAGKMKKKASYSLAEKSNIYEDPLRTSISSVPKTRRVSESQKSQATSTHYSKMSESSMRQNREAWQVQFHNIKPNFTEMTGKINNSRRVSILQNKDLHLLVPNLNEIQKKATSATKNSDYESDEVSTDARQVLKNDEKDNLMI